MRSGRSRSAPRPGAGAGQGGAANPYLFLTPQELKVRGASNGLGRAQTNGGPTVSPGRTPDERLTEAPFRLSPAANLVDARKGARAPATRRQLDSWPLPLDVWFLARPKTSKTPKRSTSSRSSRCSRGSASAPTVSRPRPTAPTRPFGPWASTPGWRSSSRRRPRERSSSSATATAASSSSFRRAAEATSLCLRGCPPRRWASPRGRRCSSTTS